MSTPDSDLSSAQLRAKASEYSARASAMERDAQLRSQAAQLSSQADQLDGSKSSVGAAASAQPLTIAIDLESEPQPSVADYVQAGFHRTLRMFNPWHPALPENQTPEAQ